MTTDELAAIVAAAQQRAGTMNQDELDRMVELAKSPKRLAWQVADENKVVLPPQGEAIDLRVTHIVCHVNYGMLESVDFIANAPRTILALVERIRELEAQRDALQKIEQREIVAFLENARNKYGKQDEFWAGMNFAIGLIKESDGL